MKKDIRVCVCGGGNAAHVMAGLFASQDIHVNVFASFEDTAERMREGIRKNNGISVTLPDGTLAHGKPVRVSEKAEDVIGECNVVILPLPSLAYESVLEDIKPHLTPGTFVGATPALGGFDWLAARVLGEKLNDVVIFGVVPLPWNCRMTDFGAATVQIIKRDLKLATLRAHDGEKENVRRIAERLFGQPFTTLDHFLAITLWPANPVIHPPRLYGMFHDYSAGQIYPANPLFYESMDEYSAECIQSVTDETRAMCRALEAHGSGGLLSAIPDVGEGISNAYRGSIADESSLMQIFRTNNGYMGFHSPMKEIAGGWVPDFTNRYFTEDIPFGLCLYKGIAEILGVETPMINKILGWAQGHMGKEYLVGGKLRGRDVPETSAPQNFGIHDIDGLLGEM